MPAPANNNIRCLNREKEWDSSRIQRLPTKGHPLTQSVLIKRSRPDIPAQLLHTLQILSRRIPRLLIQSLEHALIGERICQRAVLRLIKRTVECCEEGDVM